MHEIKAYLLSKPAAFEDYPFRLDVAVFKVKNKMFATFGEKRGQWNMNLKCAPNEALMLRDVFPSIIPGYHMNKAHWNTIVLDNTIPVGEIERMIDNSYGLVVAGMTKADRRSLETLYSSDELYGPSSTIL
ncbi:MAG: putative DNA-binding protein (MmcQ/YjbR family) [Candidatus Azotimanducaceae bacterium]|jgi:predicted DNA-binding protein (MmcQ/YjbR family)